ncbi:unnamed protein product [Rhizophagus irregularis]|nr:unnamed protein product [Rhizophagus irregularis]
MFSQNISFTANNILKYLETNFTNWTSGNEKIDDFIQERQLKINDYDMVFEWIPYNQFNEIRETGKNDLVTVYSAIWKDGPLYFNNWYYNYTRDSNKNIALKYLHNSQESIDSLIYEAKKYPTDHEAFQTLYGISQNPDTGDYILVQNSSINSANQFMLEWIPYNQFNEIKETGKNTVYSAIWKDGPLHYNQYGEYTRNPNKKVALKCLYNSQESIDSLINETKKYPTNHKAFQTLYGISQNPDTEGYILVLMWTSGNEKIDDFIQVRQLKIDNYNDIVLEWIPYNQFNEVKETGKNSLKTVYSAIWKDGPLYKKNRQKNNYIRDSNKEVALKCLHNSQESINSLLDEAKKYPTNHKAFQVLYGISQNPDTGDYILVINWTSGNVKIDDFIQEKQLKINNYNDIIPEWIPYSQFNEVKETGKNTVYSAIWKDGPLHYNQYGEYTRNPNKKVALKCLYNSQESIDSLINETKKYPTNHKAFQTLYGISQNPDTEGYILVLMWTSGNEKIDDFIQERQLKINNYNDIVLEWIPYDQFIEVKVTGKNSLITVYSAIWKDGPLYKKNRQKNNYIRDSNKEASLKCLHKSQESIDSLINEAKKISNKI